MPWLPGSTNKLWGLMISEYTKIKNAVQNRKEFISLQGQYKLTKSDSNQSRALLFRDLQLEKRALKYLDQEIGITEVLQNYYLYEQQQSLQLGYEQNKKAPTLPQHCAVNILSGVGPICSGSNIFMVFPEVLGLKPKQDEEVFGFEFVDVWENIFVNNILPCIKIAFDLSSQINFKVTLFKNLERAIFLSSVFHEIGHQIGPWKISPTPLNQMKIQDMELDVLGELSTDALLICQLRDIPEIAQFVILQRLFWFGRCGFRENPCSGLANVDNDSWIALFLWQRLQEHGILRISRSKLQFNADSVVSCFSAITKEIDLLYSPKLNKTDQQRIVKNWMKQSVPQSGGKFIYCSSFQNLLIKCQSITEQPLFNPTFSADIFEEIKKKCIGGSL